MHFKLKNKLYREAALLFMTAVMIVVPCFSCYADEYDDRIANMQEQEKQTQETISNLEKQAQAARDSIEQLKEQKQEAESNVSELKDKSAELRNEIEGYSGRLNALDDESPQGFVTQLEGGGDGLLITRTPALHDRLLHHQFLGRNH